MPNFQLSAKIDNRKTRKDREPTDWELHFNELLETFPKLKIESMSINEIFKWARHQIQIHSLRCSKCKADKYINCRKIQLLINIEDIIF